MPLLPVSMGSDESLAARWLRRAVTISAVLLALPCLGTLLLGLWPLLGLLDLLSGGRLSLLRATAFFFVLALYEAGGIVAALLVWLGTGCGRSRAAFLEANHRLQARWGTAVYRAGERLFSLKTLVEGPAPPPESGPLLCFVRHASTADTVLPVLLLGRRAGFRLRYVLKRELLYGPCLDIVGQRIPNCFVRRGGDREGVRSEEEARKVTALLQAEGGLGKGDAYVIFPEGTRFTPGKQRESLARIQQSGTSSPQARALAASLQHTLSPLRRGPLALLSANPGADLVIMAHAGLEGATTLSTLLRGRLVGQTVRVRFSRVPFADIPKDPAGQEVLLARLWRDVDEFVRLFTPPRR